MLVPFFFMEQLRISTSLEGRREEKIEDDVSDTQSYRHTVCNNSCCIDCEPICRSPVQAPGLGLQSGLLHYL